MIFLTRFYVFIISMILAIVFITIGVWYVNNGGEKKSSRHKNKQANIIEVHQHFFQVLEQKTYPINAFGVVKPSKVLDLRTPIKGKLVELAEDIKTGDFVHQGHIIAKIDPANIEAQQQDEELSLVTAKNNYKQLQQTSNNLKSELKASQTQYELRKASQQRIASLHKKGYATDSQLDEARLHYASATQSYETKKRQFLENENAIEQANRQIQRMEIKLNETKRNIGQTTITSPFSGIIKLNDIHVGKNLNANENIATIYDLSLLEIEFQLSNYELQYLLDEQSHIIRPAIDIYLTLGEKTIHNTATIERIAPNIDGAGRIFYATMPNKGDFIFKNGDFVSLSIPSIPLQNIVEIPINAFDAQNHIYLIENDSILKRFKPKILRRYNDKVIVTNMPYHQGYYSPIYREEFGDNIKVKIFKPSA